MSDPEPPDAGDVDNSRTVTLTEKDVRDAARLFRLLADKTSWSGPMLSEKSTAQRHQAAGSSSRERLISRARLLLHMRRLRTRHFNRSIFGEPGWDILLLLYLADAAEGRQTVGQIAEWTETPPTTVLRWVSYLEKEHLVERRTHPTDRRIAFVELAEKGRASLEAFLDEMPG